MPNTTINPASFDTAIDNEVTRLLQILGDMEAVPGAVRAYTAVAQYRAGGAGHLLMRAENALIEAMPATTSARDTGNLGDALIRLGRIAAFRQIGFAVA